MSLKFKKLTARCFVIIISIFVIAFSKEIANGITIGLKLCFESVIPSLYIFMIICLFITKSNIFSDSIIFKFLSSLLFGTKNETGIIYFLSLICGYPIGAKIINQMLVDNKISKTDAEKILYCSINPGPAFLINIIGQTIYENKNIGIIIFIATIISVSIGARIFKVNNINLTYKKNNESYLNCLLSSVNSANKSLVSICSWIMIAVAFSNIIKKFGTFSFLTYFIEITSGVFYAAENTSIYFLAFLIGFSGFSVHMQVMSCASDIKPNYFKILIYKVLQGLIIAGLVYLILLLFPMDISVSNFYQLSNSQNNSIISFVSLFVFTISSLIFINKKCRNISSHML